MTATDELRRLLDERGVEWMDDSYANLWCTVWHGRDGKQWRMTENRSGMLTELKAWHVTPKQAIEATLGRMDKVFAVGGIIAQAECRDLAETPEYRDKTEFKCSECGYEYSAVGGFGCDCGDEPDFRYCPNCGRKVVDA